MRFVSTDGEGKPIPTREGNKHFGWQHFAAEHNIHDPKVIKMGTITAYCERVARNKCPNAVNET
ncbi:hypothetical protein ACIA8F_34985 [Streptomyces sp. NPDC051563]|uniref:hypothetical protein n=1 Tax=Streptomyces sp. NPDC051563 TaxID=3365659 RepID=UPI0037A0D082